MEIERQKDKDHKRKPKSNISIRSYYFSNALVDFMLNGTAVKQALEKGKDLDADDCDNIYNSCPLTKEQTLQILSKMLPGAGAASN